VELREMECDLMRSRSEKTITSAWVRKRKREMGQSRSQMQKETSGFDVEPAGSP
jgi:hypothetical protein